MKSKEKIEKQTLKKTNQELVETIRATKKKKAWLEVAAILSGSRRKMTRINLDKLEKESKSGDVLVVPGKVLSMGEVKSKFKVGALSFSGKAREKLKKAGCETLSILDAIKLSPDGKGIRILKG
jgi:large subunit ribosomal protein L18e